MSKTCFLLLIMLTCNGGKNQNPIEVIYTKYEQRKQVDQFRIDGFSVHKNMVQAVQYTVDDVVSLAAVQDKNQAMRALLLIVGCNGVFDDCIITTAQELLQAGADPDRKNPETGETICDIANKQQDQVLLALIESKKIRK